MLCIIGWVLHCAMVLTSFRYMPVFMMLFPLVEIFGKITIKYINTQDFSFAL